MVQFTFFALVIISLLAGVFAYFSPSQKAVSPMKFMMDNSGYSSVETRNQKRIQELNLTTNRGLIQIHSKMDELAQEQNKFFDTVQDQQQALNNSGKDASDILLQAQQAGGVNSKDVLQLKALTAQMQDQQRLLVAQGQDLITLNDQLTKNRQWVADQIDLANINTQSSLSALQQRYSALNDQASNFFDKVTQHNQEVKDCMGKLRDKLHDLASASQQQNFKDNVQRAMDREHEDMIRLADNEERNRNFLMDAQERLANSKEQSDDSAQRSQDLIADENQKAQDQQQMVRQRIADQMQRIQDQQNR